MTSIIARVLEHAVAPTLLFAAPVADDEPGTLDLRAHDLPVSAVSMRNEVRRLWRAHPRLVVRVDDAPSPAVEALLHELVRREVRLTADDVERFSDAHRVIVKVAAAAPPARLTRLFPARMRATTGRADARRR